MIVSRLLGLRVVVCLLTDDDDDDYDAVSVCLSVCLSVDIWISNAGVGLAESRGNRAMRRWGPIC